jgi:DNA-binding NarL/FixJ family response regulator
VLQLLADGATSKEIAAELGLRPKTVENHRARILDKLGVANSAAAVRTAVANGLIVTNGDRAQPRAPRLAS